MFNVKSKMHDAKLGICIIAQVGDRFPPLTISDNFKVALDKCRWILFSNFRKPCYYFISSKLVELMGSFSPINSKTSECRPYFLGINRCRKLPLFLCTFTQFRKSFKLTNKGYSIFSFSSFSEFF